MKITRCCGALSLGMFACHFGVAALSNREIANTLTTNRCVVGLFSATAEPPVQNRGSTKFAVQGFMQDGLFCVVYTNGHQLHTIAGSSAGTQWHISGGTIAIYHEPGQYLVDKRIKELLDHLNFTLLLHCLEQGTNLKVLDQQDQMQVEGAPPSDPAFQRVRSFAAVFDKRRSMLPTEFQLRYVLGRKVTVEYSDFKRTDDKWFPGTIQRRSELEKSSLTFTIKDFKVAKPKPSEAFAVPDSGSTHWLTRSKVQYNNRLEVSPGSIESNGVATAATIKSSLTSNGVDWLEADLKDVMIPAAAMIQQSSGGGGIQGWTIGAIALGVVGVGLLIWRRRTGIAA